MYQSRQAALEAAAPMFMDWLRLEQIDLNRENWMSALKALELPALLLRGLVARPEEASYEELIYAKLLLLARGLDIDLTDREWEVMYHRCGFADGCIHSRAETGEQFGVSHMRIRQVEERLFRKIRARLRRRGSALRDFYD